MQFQRRLNIEFVGSRSSASRRCNEHVLRDKHNDID
jgi:hypothetical protein